MKTIAKITFQSPINIDNGYTNNPQGTHTSTMELYHGEDDRYGIEWIVEALDTVVGIGIYCAHNSKVVEDYDGVFELPEEAVKLLLNHGFTGPDVIDFQEYEKKYGNSAEKKIVVEVRGGVAYCDDPRVQIIDHDNKVGEVVVMQDMLDTNGFDNMTVLDKDNISVNIDSVDRIFHRSKYESVLNPNNRAELAATRELEKAFELIDEVLNTL